MQVLRDALLVERTGFSDEILIRGHFRFRTRPAGAFTDDHGKNEKEKAMASQSKETRLKQKTVLEAKLQKRLALLAEKGQDAKRIARDVLVKQLKADLKAMGSRLRAIDAHVKRTGELAAIKAERLAKPKEEAPKAKKAAPEAKPEAKPKKKKKKEGEAPKE
jgi:hypothetical protein